jgi:HKD family nuclease
MIFFNQRKSQFRDKGAKVIYGLSRYNKLLGNKLELITNTKELNHKSALTDLIDWADSCLFCTSFFDKKGLEHLLPKLLSGISDRGMKVKIFSNGEKEYTKPHIIAKLKKYPKSNILL